MSSPQSSPDASPSASPSSAVAPPAASPLEPPPEVVARLRAAGCVSAEDEARLLVEAAHTPAELDATVARRVDGEPLEHVLGWAEFCGLRIAVDPGVFVPRRRTGFLVHQAIAHVRAAARGAGGRAPVVVDLCCGSGALGVAVAAGLAAADPTAVGMDAVDVNAVDLVAADVEPAAVRCALRNVAAVGGRVYEGDLFAALPGSLRGRVDVLLANVPYVPTTEIDFLPPEARVHEPVVALDGGSDGLDLLRRVASSAPDWLAPGGCLLVETSERQAAVAVDAVARAGLTPRVASSDELYATVVIGIRPPDRPRR